MSISAYLVCHPRRLMLNLGKPLRRPDDTVTAFDQGFLQGAERAQLDRALWKFLADTAGDTLVVAYDGDDDFETIAGYREIGGDAEDGDIPLADYLGETGVPVADAPGYVYYGVRGPDARRPDLVGVLRRSVVDGHAVDEAFTRNRRWEPTLRLREQELGYGDAEAVPISADAAAEFVARISARPTG
jgi:hypothetical protein